MKYCFFLLAIFTLGCGEIASEDPIVDTGSHDSTSAVAVNTSKNPVNGLRESGTIAVTHLSDTVFIKGNVMVFFLPDSLRFENLVNNGAEGIYEVDADFGLGVSRTIDSMNRNPKFNHIDVQTTTKRFVRIADCNGGPVIFDRDSVNYGYIMSSSGHNFIWTGEVHSSDYVMDVEEYFRLDEYR